MERLGGIDASFLYMETPALHMHTIKIAVLEPAPGVPYGLERVRADLSERLHLLPPFRRRLVEVPGGLHHPVWIEDPAFDLADHVRSATVSPPGGPREMDALVGLIASAPLDRRRPLWELWVIEGLGGGRVAVVGKVHHALADGAAVAALLANVMGPGMDRLASVEAPFAWTPEPIPSRTRLLRDALYDHARPLARFPALVRRTARGLLAVTRRRRTVVPTPPRPGIDTPRVSFNGALTPARTFASVALPLDDVKAVKDAFGVTLNDVLLALVAGALRRYLAARGELPARPLVAEVPVATDRPGERRLGGNRLSNVFTSLCTDVEDPVARLQRIHEVTRVAKELQETLGADLFESWAAYAPPRPVAWVMRLYSRLRLADLHPPPVNVIVSCVAGPRVPLEWPGGRLAAIYSVGPIIQGAGLNITAWSYVDRLNVGVLGCPDLIAAPHDITRGLELTLRELHAAVPSGRERSGATG